VLGYHRIPFAGLFWKYVDIDPAGPARGAQ
jgi:hypothetical protein